MFPRTGGEFRMFNQHTKRKTEQERLEQSLEQPNHVQNKCQSQFALYVGAELCSKTCRLS